MKEDINLVKGQGKQKVNEEIIREIHTSMAVLAAST